MMLPPKKAKSVRVASYPSDLPDPHRNPKMNKKGRFYFSSLLATKHCDIEF